MNTLQTHPQQLSATGVYQHPSINKVNELPPEQQPFPSGFNFSYPARYHTAGQVFKVGDLCWYEIQCYNANASDYIQWGEATVMEVLPNNKYRLAGKTWKYDHFTHPLMGLPGGPPQYMNVSDIHSSRNIYQRWASSSHPSSHVRRSALSGTDEVAHPALASVPGEAMFKVWNREIVPPCPVSSLRQNEESEEGKGQHGHKTYSLEDARKLYGNDLQFKGMKQNGMGPEFWGITLDQLMTIKDLPAYDESMTMYDVVTQLIKPATSGKGMGYALLLNQERPLRAVQMVSHAWGENFSHFVQALNDSYCSGPFWVCACAIYQENADVIAKQLGPSLEHGPFATVLKQATDMIAVFTPAADIYLRMWCVFEIFIAVKYGVNIQFAAFNRQMRSGIENIYDAIYAHGKDRCNSIDATCSNTSDEKQIRDLINLQDGEFNMLDSVVEWCKATYYMNQVSHPGIAFKSPLLHVMLLGGQGKLDYLAKTLSSVALAMDRIEDLKLFLEHSSTKTDSSTIGKESRGDHISDNESHDLTLSFRDGLQLDEDQLPEEKKTEESHDFLQQETESSLEQQQSNLSQNVRGNYPAPPEIEVITLPTEGGLSTQDVISPLAIPIVKQVKFALTTSLTSSKNSSLSSSSVRNRPKTKRNSSVERMRQLYDQSDAVSARREAGKKRRSEVKSLSEHKRTGGHMKQHGRKRSLSAPEMRHLREQSEKERVNVTRMRQLYDQSKSVSARQEEGRKKRSSVERTLQKRETVRTGKYLESKRIASAKKKNDENRFTFKQKLEKKPNKMTIDQARSTYDRLLTYKKRTEDRRATLKKEREARETKWTKSVGKIPLEQASRMYYRRTGAKKPRSKSSIQTR